jgi:hypothetical protein
MKTYTLKIHLTERTDNDPTERYFDAWLEGPSNVLAVSAQMCAMDSHAAIAYCVAVEKSAFEFGLSSKFDEQGNPVEAEIVVERVHENF